MPNNHQSTISVDNRTTMMPAVKVERLDAMLTIHHNIRARIKQRLSKPTYLQKLTITFHKVRDRQVDGNEGETQRSNDERNRTSSWLRCLRKVYVSGVNSRARSRQVSDQKKTSVPDEKETATVILPHFKAQEAKIQNGCRTKMPMAQIKRAVLDLSKQPSGEAPPPTSFFRSVQGDCHAVELAKTYVSSSGTPTDLYYRVQCLCCTDLRN